MKNFCIDCNKEINKQSKRCPKCAGIISGKKQTGHKITDSHKRRISEGLKNSSHYNLERHKIYYCKEKGCDNTICYATWKSGSKLCRKHAGILHSKKMKLKYKDILHPNYKHGCAHCIDCLKQGIKTEIKFGSKRCQKHFNKFNSGKNNFWYGKIPKPYWGKYKDINMRSNWEIKYAKYLDKNNIKWQYESKRFYFEDCTYLPDFYLPENNEYIEIKGWWRKDDKKRFDLFKKIYPKVRISVLQLKELKSMGVL